jgi:hypothetical protein
MAGAIRSLSLTVPDLPSSATDRLCRQGILSKYQQPVHVRDSVPNWSEVLSNHLQ